MARGGSRPNAGRYPKGTTDGRKYVTIRLSQKACDFLTEYSDLTGESRGKVVESLIDHYLASLK